MQVFNNHDRRPAVAADWWMLPSPPVWYLRLPLYMVCLSHLQPTPRPFSELNLHQGTLYLANEPPIGAVFTVAIGPSEGQRFFPPSNTMAGTKYYNLHITFLQRAPLPLPNIQHLETYMVSSSCLPGKTAMSVYPLTVPQASSRTKTAGCVGSGSCI